jgi:hypothetical protein
LRSTIGINDYGAFAGKALENASLNGADDGLNRLSIVVRRQAYDDIYLAYVDKLAKKIIGEKGLFRQFILRAKFSGRSVVPRQFEPAPLVTIVNEGGFIAADLHAIVEDRIGVRVTEELVS